ncbi:TetR family transcriptional regulator [Amycolatopsis taiwanensis]|uniref:TetR family transcriptional regulator n=1 Tax=Amycolatopsis taiwanensis TaxID=342230 RepID=A0A9W6VHV8_9PSEU|nr:TetR family transcriptional regulator [Amycolatopsis taiwanensis]
MPVRSAYHHGDLRNALIHAAADLAREGGPRSVTIRAAARVVGVTPTAAYRHFAGHEELLDAAKEQALERMTAAMNTELARLPPGGDRVRRALRNLAAIGLGYLNFATAEPGLFRTCFAGGMPAVSAWDAGPFRKAIAVVDDLADAGYLSPEQRPMAEMTIWAAVHGLAMLYLDGPLREADDEVRLAAMARTFEVVAVGLGERPLPADLRDEIVGLVRGG